MTTKTETYEITLTDVWITKTPVCEAHDGWPLHIVTECDLLAGVVPFTESVQCSVCELQWGFGLESQHLRCAWLKSDGTRDYAYPQLLVKRGSEWIEVRTPTA